MHQIIRAFRVKPNAPSAYAVVTCLIPELHPKQPFVPVLRIVLHEGCGAAVNPGTMETVRVALGRTLGLKFFDQKPIDPIAGCFGETINLGEEVPENEREPDVTMPLVAELQPADIIKALRSLSPRDPVEEAALQEQFYLPEAA